MEGGLQKLDGLLLSDLNLAAGVFDLRLCDEFKSTSLLLRRVIYVRVAITILALGMLIYCFALNSGGTYRAAEGVAAVFSIIAASIFIVTRFKLKQLSREPENKGILTGNWMLAAYVAMYLMPIASFFNLGVAITLNPSKQKLKTAAWAIQLFIKSVCTLVLVIYVTYYKVYAEAWHCYTHESDLKLYKHGYCPSYTHQDNYLDPGNSICRPDSGIAHRACNADRTADQIPRRWLSHGRWTYFLLLVAIHITMAQAIEGINGVRDLFY